MPQSQALIEEYLINSKAPKAVLNAYREMVEYQRTLEQQSERDDNLRKQLSNLANKAERLDSQLVTRDDGVLESMYTYNSQRAREDMFEAIQEVWETLGE